MTRALLQQALDNICGAKLCEINSMSSRAETRCLLDKATIALRGVLAAPEPEPVAYLVEGWHDGKLIAHIPHLTLEDAKASAAVFSQHYTTTKLVSLYAAPPIAFAVPDGSSASSLLTKMERLRHLTPMDVGDTWEDQYAEIVEAIELLAAPVVREPLRDDAFHAWVEETSADHPNLLERQEFRDAMYNAWINGYNTRVDEQAHGITGGKP